MVQYASLTKHEIEVITRNMSIGDIISIEVLSGGWENTNYLINAINGKYVCTIFEQKSFGQVKELAKLLSYLESQGFETSKIIYNDSNELVTIWKGKPIMIKKFIMGFLV